jgi:hypothetical protein
VEEEQAEGLTESLVGEIERTDYLQPLAERPLMLSMMADLHWASGGRFRGGRAGLYEESVRLLLDRWNDARERGEGTGEKKTAAEHLGMRIDKIRSALEELAYEVHRERGRESGTDPSEITVRELSDVLRKHRRPPSEQRVDEWQVSEYLHQRSGILVGESSKLFRFPHRSYQEYLAACHLFQIGFPTLLLDEVRSDPTLWREVVQLAVGKAETPFTAWAILAGLVPKLPEPEPSASSWRSTRRCRSRRTISGGRCRSRTPRGWSGSGDGWNGRWRWVRCRRWTERRRAGSWVYWETGVRGSGRVRTGFLRSIGWRWRRGRS